ncbi:hypothetical protein E2320_016979 [Naja naja]|nr:hypothetical protein E2320_016979 [Naja naja]
MLGWGLLCMIMPMPEDYLLNGPLWQTRDSKMNMVGSKLISFTYTCNLHILGGKDKIQLYMMEDDGDHQPTAVNFYGNSDLRPPYTIQ